MAAFFLIGSLLVSLFLSMTALMLSSLVLVTLVAVRDRAHADLKTVRWAMVGNLFGAGVGASVLASLPPHAFAVLFGLLVLLGVGLSTTGFRVAVTRNTALGAGWLGDFMATTSAIGGPPLAMLYQHEDSTWSRRRCSRSSPTRPRGTEEGIQSRPISAAPIWPSGTCGVASWTGRQRC